MTLYVGLKYCGGCTPRFDRTGFVDQLKKNILIRDIRFVHYEDERAGDILIVTGCQSACVDKEPFLGRRVHIVSKEEDLDSITKTLLSIS